MLPGIKAGVCRVHRGYQGRRKPRVACETCWMVWTLEILRELGVTSIKFKSRKK
jgi:hypothetical protein